MPHRELPRCVSSLLRLSTRRLIGLALALVLGCAALLLGLWSSGRGPFAAPGATLLPLMRPGEMAQRFSHHVDVVQPGDFSRIRDCADPVCPWLRVLPSGRFTMGDDAQAGGDADEAPTHEVVIQRRFAVMETEVSVAQFKVFVADSGYQHSGGCVVWNGKEFVDDPKGSWRQPFEGLAPDDRQPVVCVSWIDAQAYAHWMTRNSGQVYRLLTEAEWEYAARAGSTSRFNFGDNEAELCLHGNVADASARRRLPYIAGASCDDGYAFVAPVASFLPNAWGLYDTLGNAWEWVQDCKSAYVARTGDAKAVEVSDCPFRLLRGGGWGNRPGGARSANRDAGEPGHRDNSTGFRLARELAEPRAPAASR
jgi:formylglycine-generating enzyme required for sulfatase activity